MGDVLTQAEVEAELTRLGRLLEETTVEYGDLCVKAAEAEAAYKRAYHERMVRIVDAGVQSGRKMTAAERDSRVAVKVHDEYRAAELLEARVEAAKQALYSMRAQLNALQTISANVRAQS